MLTSFPNINSLLPVGSVLKFYYIHVDDILFEPEIFNNKLIGAYTFKPGKSLLTGLFDKDSAKFDFTDNSGDKGPLIKNSFAATISASSTEYDQLFCEMRNRRLIVFVADHEKNVRVLGRVANGAVFSFSFSTNKKREDAPEYDYKFVWEAGCCPPITTQITDLC